MYIWERANWTQFSYQIAVIKPKLILALELQKRLIGKAKELPEGLDHQAEMDALIQNALQTSAIEDESLNVGSVRSSVVKHLGLEHAGYLIGKKNSSTKQTESLVAMLCNATRKLNLDINQQALCQWQAALFPEPPLLRKINIGKLRGASPMQVVSEKSGREIVHYEAPPKKQLSKQLAFFLKWFNQKEALNTVEKQKGSNDINDLETGMIRAAITHLWILTLHPFDDGNGRVARALTDRALAQVEQTSIRFYSMSSAIEMKRNEYYKILEETQSCLTEFQKRAEHSSSDITAWLLWFINVLAEAMQQGIDRIDRVVNKSKFWQRHSQTILSERQVKVLNRLLDNLGAEFLQGINAGQYKSLAKVSKATATRDLADLLSKQCLQLMPGGGRSTRYCVWL